MYLEKRALRINPMLSSRAIMTLLTQKYKDIAKILCGIGNKQSDLTNDEVLMLLRTPSFRLSTEKTYFKLVGKPLPDNTFFERLSSLTIRRESLLMPSSNPSFDC